MSDALSPRAAELRAAFDAGFAAPRPASVSEEARAARRFLLLRVGGEAEAIAMHDVAAVVEARCVVPVPSAVPELVGIAAHRGAIVPVYDLPALRGRAPSEPGAGRSSLILCPTRDGADDALVGLSGFELEGYVETSPVALADQRSIIDLAALMSTVRLRITER
jgi:chemotaxis signal transduction protein